MKAPDRTDQLWLTNVTNIKKLKITQTELQQKKSDQVYINNNLVAKKHVCI